MLPIDDHTHVFETIAIVTLYAISSRMSTYQFSLKFWPWSQFSTTILASIGHKDGEAWKKYLSLFLRRTLMIKFEVQITIVTRKSNRMTTELLSNPILSFNPKGKCVTIFENLIGLTLVWIPQWWVFLKDTKNLIFLHSVDFFGIFNS